MRKFTRRFSLEDKDMHYSIDDLLLGSMQYFATYNPQEQSLYLPEKRLQGKKKLLYDLCDLNARSLKSHLQKLKDKKLIEKVEIQPGEVVYTFPYNEGELYQIIDWEMLYYVVSTRNKFAVKIYLYLLDKYLWKLQEQEYYSFTVRELCEMMGYSGRCQSAEKLVGNVLESFSREGVIEFKGYYETMPAGSGMREIAVPKKRLVFVARTKSEIRTSFTG